MFGEPAFGELAYGDTLTSSENNPYSKDSQPGLNLNDDDLLTYYTDQEMIDVATEDDVYVDQVGDGYNVHEFKDDATGFTSSTPVCKLKSDLAPSTSGVYLEVFNQNTAQWEEVDHDDTTAANTKFTLTGFIPDITDYVNGSNIIAYRVWQQVV